jgi:uncharacterized membrane protein YeiH
MSGQEFPLPPFFDYSATFFWAISGGLVAARRGYDVVGIVIVAMVSATGGGLLRDGLFLQQGPPVLVKSPIYLELILSATVVVMLAGRRVQRIPGFTRVISLFDALGLGAYAVVGMDRAAAAGLSGPGVILVGMVNAVGGSILRSVIIVREPHVLRPGKLEALAALIGCGLFVLMTSPFKIDHIVAAWITIFVVFGTRLLSLACRLETKPLRDFEEDWKNEVLRPD